jgi:hypothetical protein
MDYARFNYIAQPGDNVALMPDIGVYDKWAAKWGYSWLPNITKSDDETPTLNKWVLENREQIHWYGRQQGSPVDPRAQTEDLGDDAMKASSYGLANLKRIVPNLVSWTTEAGENYDELDELYGQVIGQWNRYNGHVRSNIGGIHETYKTADEKGAVYEYTPKEKQKRAMNWLLENTFATPNWMLDREVLRRIEGTGSAERIRTFQASTLNSVLDADRIIRLIEAEAEYGRDTYSATEMLTDLRNGVWSELRNGISTDVYRRNLQRAYIDQLGQLMKETKVSISGWGSSFYAMRSINVSQSDLPALVRSELKTLQSQLKRSSSSDRLTQIHYQDALARIEMILDED